jgi:endogenous inhibitor of DNA gyrase (YacG/DUF329 family)
VLCPICKKSVQDEGPDRLKAFPFCSDRCKLIDLGRWLDGKYQIPVHDPQEAADEDIPSSPDRSSPKRETFPH